MIETRRPTGFANHFLHRYLGDVRRAPRVEPRIIRRHRPTVRADADHPSHLAVNANTGYVFHPRLADAVSNRLAHGRHMPVGILLAHFQLRPVQFRRTERAGQTASSLCKQRRLRPLRADVNTDQHVITTFRHLPDNATS